MADFMYKIFNEDCIKTLERFKLCDNKFDIVMTSPPYNTGRNSTSERSRENREARYDIHIDNMSSMDYCNWCCDIFNLFDSTLKKTVLFYGMYHTALIHRIKILSDLCGWLLQK